MIPLFLFYNNKIQMLFQEKKARFQAIILQEPSHGYRKSEKDSGIVCMETFRNRIAEVQNKSYDLPNSSAKEARKHEKVMQVFVD